MSDSPVSPHDRYDDHEKNLEQSLPSLVARSVERFVENTIIPKAVRERIKRTRKTAAEKIVYASMAPMSMPMRTVSLFADISGFTNMTNALAAEGPKGSEQIVLNLNRYQEQLVKSIIGAGGDILKFAGDAIIAIWPSRADCSLDKQREMLALKSHRAIQCAMTIQRDIPEMGGVTSSGMTLVLSVKLGIGCGDAMMLHVGGVLGRMEALVVGPALQEAYNCESECESGQVIISKTVHSLISDVVQVRQPTKPGGKSAYGNKLVRTCDATKNQSLVHLFPNDEGHSHSLLERLEAYIPIAVVPHIETNATKWAAELRRTSNLFMLIDFELEQVEASEEFDPKIEQFVVSLHNIVRTVQECVYEQQGALNKFLFDDKGATLLAFFGLPPGAHSNDPQRAVLAGLMLLDRIQKEHNVQIWIGVTTGTVYTGLVGSVGTRWEYSAIGNSVNLAARLAAKAKKKPELPNILCDQSIFDEVHETQKRVILLSEGSFLFKGYDDPQNVYSISRNPAWEDTDIVNTTINKKIMLGASDRIWQRNLQTVSDVVDVISNSTSAHSSEISAQRTRDRQSSLLRQSRHKDYGQVILVEGGMGCGKTQFIRVVSSRFRSQAIFAWGRGDCFHSLEGHPVWQQILNRLFKKCPRETKGFARRLGKYILQRRPSIQPFMFLVNDIFFPTDPFDRNLDMIKGLSDRKLSYIRYDIIFLFIEMIAMKKAVVVVVDELQFLGSEDWLITRRICSLIRQKILFNIAVILGSQPMHLECYKPNYVSPKLVQDYKELRGTDATLVLKPSKWPIEITRQFTEQILKVHKVSNAIVQIVHERCGGTPGLINSFVMRLNMNVPGCTPHIKTLKNEVTGTLSAQFTEDTEDDLKKGVDVHITIPPSIWHSTAALLDHVRPEHMIILKTGAVICVGQSLSSTVFSKHMMMETHPIKAYRSKIDRNLRELDMWGFIKLRDTGEEGYTLPNREPMPKVKDLLRRPPAHSKEHYKSGRMFKKTQGRVFSKEVQRLFVFKHNTLYWMEKSDDTFPKNRWKFNGKEVLGVARKGDHILFKAATKTWMLRCEKKLELDSWFTFLQERINEQYEMEKKRKEFPSTRMSRASRNKGSQPLSMSMSGANGDSGSHGRASEMDDEKEDIGKPRWTFIDSLNKQQRTSLQTAVNQGSDLRGLGDDLGFEMNDEQAAMALKYFRRPPSERGPTIDFEESDDYEKFYEFSYGFLRDVIYEQMLHSQRKQLHMQCKQHYAKKKGEDPMNYTKWTVLEARNLTKATT